MSWTLLRGVLSAVPASVPGVTSRVDVQMSVWALPELAGVCVCVCVSAHPTTRLVHACVFAPGCFSCRGDWEGVFVHSIPCEH